MIFCRVHTDVNLVAIHRERFHFVFRKLMKNDALSLLRDAVEQTAITAAGQQVAIGIEGEAENIGVFRSIPFLNFPIGADVKNLSIRTRTREEPVLFVGDERPHIGRAQFAERFISLHRSRLA